MIRCINSHINVVRLEDYSYFLSDISQKLNIPNVFKCNNVALSVFESCSLV